MRGGYKGDRRPDRRAFRPGLGFEGPLESRFLLAMTPTGAHSYGHPREPRFVPPPKHIITHVLAQVAHGGQSAVVTSTSGNHFVISISQATGLPGMSPPTNTGQAAAVGNVRVYPMTGGRVGIIVDGTNDQSVLAINPVAFPKQKGTGHTFGAAQAGRAPTLQVGAITVTSGQIAQIVGFHTVDLSGPLVVGSTNVVDRIALNSVQPGGSIQVGGTLNTLDILNGATFSEGPGLIVGRDLNLINVGQDLTFVNGASFRVGRDLGLFLQPPKGTGTGSNVLTLNIPTLTNTITQVAATPAVSGYIQGNLNIGPGSIFSVGRAIDNVFLVQGQVNGATRLSVPNGIFGTQIGQQTSTGQFANFVSLGGYFA